MKSFSLLALLAVLAIDSTAPVHAMATEEVGPDKIRDHQSIAQPGWPHGIVDLLRDDARIYSLWVNGNESFFFDAAPAELGGLVRKFSEMRLRDHELWLKTGTPEVKSFGGKTYQYNVQLHVLSGIALAMSRREGASAATFEPTLTIHVDPEKASDTLEHLELPDNIILHNEVKGSTLTGREKKPERTLWHARVDFDNGQPACDYEHGVSTIAALWEKENPNPINLGKVTNTGGIGIPLSEHELKLLKAKELWITLTAGNWATKPHPDHPRLDPGLLSPDLAKAKPVVLNLPVYYHGRILFEDGSPPVLDPLPWPGAELGVNFSFAGQVSPDAEGYFKVFFTADQIEELRRKKVRKNIYVPSYERRNSSTALHSFPAGKLSRHKAKAGVVRIPNPAPAE